jgi:zinc-ribbon domain
MALIKCVECGEEISDTAKSCPKCGAKVPKAKLWIWIPLGLIAAFFIIGLLAGNTPEGEQKSKERYAISYCWNEQKRKSFDAAGQQFIAGACENEFRKKYGVNP